MSTTQQPGAKGQSKAWFYLLLWLFFVYLFTQILGFSSNTNSNIVLGGMYFIEFGVHEVSHLVTAFLPPILCATAGSIGEVSFTVLMAVAAYRAKSYMALGFTLLWVMLAANSAGIYMADARAQQLQLVGAGPDPKHDWNFVFGQLGWLDWDTFIGTFVRVMGDFAGVAALIIGILIVSSLFRQKPAEKP
jgi:hypothetical protein